MKVNHQLLIITCSRHKILLNIKCLVKNLNFIDCLTVILYNQYDMCLMEY